MSAIGSIRPKQVDFAKVGGDVLALALKMLTGVAYTKRQFQFMIQCVACWRVFSSTKWLTFFLPFFFLFLFLSFFASFRGPFRDVYALATAFPVSLSTKLYEVCAVMLRCVGASVSVCRAVPFRKEKKNRC